MLALAGRESLRVKRPRERIVEGFDILRVERERLVVGRHGIDVVIPRLKHVRLRLEQLHLRVQDIELGARARIEPLTREAQGFGRLHHARRRGIDGLAGLQEVRDRRLHVQHNLRTELS